jgi:hypothetical protein
METSSEDEGKVVEVGKFTAFQKQFFYIYDGAGYKIYRFYYNDYKISNKEKVHSTCLR